jgi:hypothetical protein
MEWCPGGIVTRLGVRVPGNHTKDGVTVSWRDIGVRIRSPVDSVWREARRLPSSHCSVIAKFLRPFGDVKPAVGGTKGLWA